MGCGCGGKKKPSAAKVTEVKTSGAWKLEVNGQTLYFDTRVGATAENLRRFSGKGVVTRS